MREIGLGLGLENALAFLNRYWRITKKGLQHLATVLVDQQHEGR